MKIRERLSSALVQRGLFDRQAKVILEEYLAGDLGKEMRGRMDDDETEYPEALMVGVWFGVKQTALAWMNRECPKHWARELFEGPN